MIDEAYMPLMRWRKSDLTFQLNEFSHHHYSLGQPEPIEKVKGFNRSIKEYRSHLAPDLHESIHHSIQAKKAESKTMLTEEAMKKIYDYI
jgi:hypothetical protein